MRNIFFVLLSLTICNCTYHYQSQDPLTPVTYETPLYRSADSVGILRRLALLPMEIKSYKGGKYEAANDQEAAALIYEGACANFLTEKKGYEIVVVRDADKKWRSELLKNSGYDNIQDLYQEWRQGTAEKHTAMVIQKLGRALNVDGVLVIWVKQEKPWGLTEGILNIVLIDIPLFYHMASPDIGAWIYETSTGRLVWREEYSLFDVVDTITTDSVINLFTDLQNAIPQQLLK